MKAALREKNPSKREQMWQLVNNAVKNIIIETCQRFDDSMLKSYTVLITN